MTAQGTPSRGTAGRRGYRIELSQLVYVNLPGDPFILNLSENGMAIQAMEILEPGCSLPVAFPLPDTNKEVRGLAKIVWSDRSGRAGVEFEELSQFDRFQLKQWVNGHQDIN